MEKLFGWMTCTSYQADPHRSLESWKQMVDEMAEYGLNFLAIDFNSDGWYDKRAWGIDWPAQDPMLKSYRNPGCPNSDVRTEYVSQVLDYARSCGIEHLYLFMGMYVWRQVMEAHPELQSEFTISQDRRVTGGCIDNPEYFGFMERMVADLATYYQGKANGFMVEGPRYNWRPQVGYYEPTREIFRKENGLDIYEADRDFVREWKRKRIAQLIAELAEVAKSNGYERFGVHNDATICVTAPNGDYIVGGIEHWGQRCESAEGPEHYQQTGVIDFVAPEQHMLNKKCFMNHLAYSAEHMPCVPHLCCRNKVTPKYRDPAKKPADIERQIDWLLEFKESNPHGGNLYGATYFNEAGCGYGERLDLEVRKAVLEGLRRLRNGIA